LATNRGRTTIADIASLAGSSVPTVSKVLNGRSGVSAETRNVIQNLLDEHGYRRRGTVNKKPIGLIDFVIRDLDTIWALPLIAGAESEAAKVGASLVVTSTHGRLVGNRHWIQQLASRRTDAVVLVLSELQPGAELELTRLNTPLVLVDPAGGNTLNAPSVAATNWAGGLAATEHLIELGHTRVGMITGPKAVACARDRLDGYRAALTRANLTHDPALERFGDFQQESGQQHADSLLRMENPPTAIFAGSDRAAAGVYRAAHARGLRIPEDLSVVGFDDVVVAQWLQPELTTVRQPLEEMARTAIRTAMRLVNGEPVSLERIELATTLVVRASTAPRRA